MNATQIKYTRQRIEEIAKIKTDEIVKKHPTKRRSSLDYYNDIKEGRAKLKDTPSLYSNQYVNTCVTTYFDFPEFDDGRGVLTKALKELAQYKSGLLDQLLLGDVSEALSALNDFAKKEF